MIKMGTNKEEDYAYQIVEFVRRGRKTDIKSADCVPSHWISFNKNKGKVECQYMAPPYNEEDYLLLNSLIKSRAEAPKDWPYHTVKIKGGARTYEEGLNRVALILKDADYAFSHDSEVPPEKQAAELVRKHKQTQLKLSKETQDALKVSPLQSDPEEQDEEHDKERLKNKIKKSRQPVPSKKSSVKLGRSAGNIVFPATATKPEVEIPINRNPRDRTTRPRKESYGLHSLAGHISSDGGSDDETLSNDYDMPAQPNLDNSEIDSDEQATLNQKELDLEKQKKEAEPSKSNQKCQNSSRSSDSQSYREERYMKSKSKTECEVQKNKSRLSLTAESFLKKIYNDLQVIKMDLERIRVDLKELNVNQNRLLETQRESEIGNIIQKDFVTKYCLELPFKDKSQFDKFDDNLSQDKNCREDFMKSLCKFFDISNITSKTLTNILKKYLSGDLAVLFTAIKQMPGKYLFSQTKFYGCLLSVLQETHRDPLTGNFITEKVFLVNLGNVLCNSKDWKSDRPRRALSTKRKANQPRDDNRSNENSSRSSHDN